MLTDTEIKLLTLALNHAAYEGEADNAAVMLIRKLRERKATPADVTEAKAEVIYVEREPTSRKASHMNTWGRTMPFGKHRGEPLELIPHNYLRWVLRACQNISNDLREAIHATIYG